MVDVHQISPWSWTNNNLHPINFRARRDAPGDCVSWWESVQPLTCFTSVTLLHFVYGYTSTGYVIDSQIRLYLISYGILFSNLNVSIIFFNFNFIIFIKTVSASQLFWYDYNNTKICYSILLQINNQLKTCEQLKDLQ